MAGNRYYGRPVDSTSTISFININSTQPDFVALPFVNQTEADNGAPIQNQAYFVYIGHWPIGSVWNYVAMNLTQIGGQQPTEVGFFYTDSAPNADGQMLTKIASTASFDSVTSGLGPKRNQLLMSATLFTDSFLWCGYRHSGALAQPRFSGIGVDLGQAYDLILNSSPAFSSTVNFFATLNATAVHLSMRGERYPIV